MHVYDITHLIAEYVKETNFDGISEKTITKSKLCLLDWIGVALAGSRESISDIVTGLCKELGGNAQATILGKRLKTNLLFASLINGTNAHVLDFDDGLMEGPGHPSAPIIASILPLAECRRLSGIDFIQAYVIGVQLFFAIKAANMPYHSDEGWHSTGTVGHLAAAAACAKLLNLSVPGIKNALGISATQSAGLKNVFGTMSKPLNAGKAAMDGLLASLLAERDFTAPPNAVGGKNGFLEVFSSTYNPKAFEDALKGKSFLEEVRFKAYPSCFNTHAAIDCVLNLRSRYAFSPQDVDNIKCTVYPRCLEVSANPKPDNGLEAKFSVQYCVAMALHEGKVDLGSFDDSKIDAPYLRSAMELISLRSESVFSDTRSSEVVIHLKNGQRLKERVSLTEKFKDPVKEKSDVYSKFRNISSFIGLEEDASEIINLIDALEELPDMSILTNRC